MGTCAYAPTGSVDVIPEALWAPDLVLQGRVLEASNATFVGEVGGVRAVYKPIAGEKPLWDFPDGTLAHREVASYEVSEALGWDIVPPTILRDGPHGPGMVQLWITVDDSSSPVDLVRAGQMPSGARHVLDGLDGRDRPVSLIHEDTSGLRRMALFDVVVNNADRKGGHVLALAGGRRHGVDHGLTFHVEPKLRTVLWGWAAQPLTADELEALKTLRLALEGHLGERLGDLLAPDDVVATAARVDDLVAQGTFPVPQETGYPAIPWPPF